MSFGSTAGSEYSGARPPPRPSPGTPPPPPTHTRARTHTDMVMGRDVGRLGVEGSGHLRIERRDQSKLVRKQQHKGAAAATASSGGGLGGTGGVSSSLAFTPLAGLELANPAAAAERARRAAATDGYFSSTGTFTQIRRV